MDYERIVALIDRYFAGETSLEEERALRTYFLGETVDPRLSRFRPFFRHLSTEAARHLPGQTLENMLQVLPTPASAGKREIIRRMWLPLTRVAAALLLLLAATWWWSRPALSPAPKAIDWSKYEVRDEEEALRITRGALLQVSSRLNRNAARAAGEFGRIREVGKFLE